MTELNRMDSFKQIIDSYLQQAELGNGNEMECYQEIEDFVDSEESENIFKSCKKDFENVWKEHMLKNINANAFTVENYALVVNYFSNMAKNNTLKASNIYDKLIEFTLCMDGEIITAWSCKLDNIIDTFGC